MATMSNDAVRLNALKNRIEQARTQKATLEGRQATLEQQSQELQKAMKEDFGAKDLKALDKKIQSEEKRVEKLVSSLEKDFGDA